MFSNEEFLFIHAGRRAGVGAFSSAQATSTSIDRLVDSLVEELVLFSVTEAIDIDLDRGVDTNPIDRLIIAAGHSFDGLTITVQAADDAAQTLGVTALGSFPITGTGVIFETLTSPNAQQHVRLSVPIGSAAHFLGELVYSESRIPVRGPEQRWTDEDRDNVAVNTTRSGVQSSLKRGEQRRIWIFQHQALGAGADLDIFDDLDTEIGGTHRTFWWVPFDNETDPLHVRLRRSRRRRQDHPQPARFASTFTITLEIIEALG